MATCRELLNQGSFQMLTDHTNVTVKKKLLVLNLPLDKGHFITGMENETQITKDMPFRVIGYDGASYRDQLFPVKNTKGKTVKNTYKRFPVVSLVLHFGEKHWDSPVTLYKNLGDFDQRLKPYVNVLILFYR